MKIWVDFLQIFFYDEGKKNEEKKIMGIAWGLCHRKIARVPEYLNHQSPQPNPHTFFFTLKNNATKIKFPHFIYFLVLSNDNFNFFLKKSLNIFFI